MNAWKASVFGNPDGVAAVYLVGGLVFIAGVFAAAFLTGARVLYYRRNHQPRPRLLTRDLITKGGFAISFGLITLIRFLPPETRTEFTAGNVPWALATTIPACVSVVVYCWYEIWVIERPTPV